ncbi:DUF4350 domain-containing protein [Dyella flagellata]|uniref:DUF4350 domain-containing protein n=1 Tax=Dyella flagellata TaxID=1867833 RepID=A0ABQ5XDM3_9GAMM|nr:DUF4350 domain-containing protein [Dyella flagellata]GLQ88635.1 hypothetical protein GCM10007898_22050 [Dyella flagellata]
MKIDSRLAAALIVLGVIVLGSALFFGTYKREWTTETTATSGEARYNRFFALQQVLQNMGQPASSSVLLDRVLPSLEPGDTVVIGDDVGRIKPVQAQRLAAWVRTGGHLVFAPASYGSRDVPLLEAFGWLGDQKKPGLLCATLSTGVTAQADAAERSMILCGTGFHLQAQARAELVIGDNVGKGLLFARVKEGRGTVSLLSNLGALSGHELKHLPEQLFAQRLLAPNFGRGHFYLLYELVGGSFWVNLFVRGWPALFASLLLILGWMAVRSERFGPLAPAPDTHRRALLEHIHAVGEFLFRRDGGRSLHRLACESILARLRRSDPASAMLGDEELYAWLAQRSRLEPARIRYAFRSPANATAFRSSMTILARLRSHL